VDREISPVDGYFDRVLKCVPVEVTSVYVLLLSAATTAFDGAALRWWTFLLFALGVLGTPAYARLALGIERRAQLVMTTLAFLVIVAVGGGWFATFSWWSGFYPLLLTVVFGVAVALLRFAPPRSRPARRRGGPVRATEPAGAPAAGAASPTEPPTEPVREPATQSSLLDEDSPVLRVWRGVDPPGSVRP
jgi:hypothetical protein